ncbi:calponin [Sporothrix epigloea]|uniref:Calponin n=1 Tax=Sporothrix epigloea TaxID=1892477 RepID=A0ABP0D7V6_9PEZI
MASVSSLDRDLRKMRFDKYTPGAAREVREWIEDILNEPLASGDLLEALKDGVALCRLANLAIPPPGLRFKQSAMPFVQMENISHFLHACQAPPLNLQQHDCFLTVDLYEAKDPAQVLQCLGAFSRAANRVKPSAFPTTIGSRTGSGSRAATPASPPSNKSAHSTTAQRSSGRPVSSIYSGHTPLAHVNGGEGATSGRWSPTKGHKHERSISPSKSPTSTSSWSKRELEGSTAPAWNIAQYGYMGGASQGNLGISFGGRRQITSAGPSVPNAVEKQRLRLEREAEETRQKEEERRRTEMEAEKERARHEEEIRWEEETRRQREEKKRKAEEERRKWEEEERQWKLTEEARLREEEEAEVRLIEEREQRLRQSNNNKSAGESANSEARMAGAASGEQRLRGQLLSQYQADNNTSSTRGRDGAPEDYSNRVRELEEELELARQREQAYERERQGLSSRSQAAADSPRDDRTRSKSRGARSRSRPRNSNLQVSPPVRQESWSRNDKEVLMTPRSQSRHRFADNGTQEQQQYQQMTDKSSSTPHTYEDEDDTFVRTLQQQGLPLSKSPRPLPDPRALNQQQQQQKPQLPPRLNKQPTGERQPQQLQQPPPGTTSGFQKIGTDRAGEDTSSPAEGDQGISNHGRPLPDPSLYATSFPQQPQQPPRPTISQQQQQQPLPTYSRELLGGGVAEHDAEDRRRRQQAYQPNQQQQPLIKQRQPFRSTPQAVAPVPVPFSGSGGLGGRSGAAGKSLLEREMELERQRQREWEEAQRATAAAPRQTENVDGVNGRWDVNQWSGYTGGDGQNRGSQGIGAGRRQIVGPRPLPGQR